MEFDENTKHAKFFLTFNYVYKPESEGGDPLTPEESLEKM